MSFDVEQLQQHLPSYLSSEDRRLLSSALRDIASGVTSGYFLSNNQDVFINQMLQGDGWRGFQLYIHEQGNVRSTRGLVLSNSCDVSPDNKRDTLPKVTFAPLVRLSQYERVLYVALKKEGNNKMTEDKVREKISAIKSQKVTNIFYIPAGTVLEEDYVVRLDEAQSMPLSMHANSGEAEKIFTLNNVGFYMLIFKLSVHFCRLHEEVQRNDQMTV